MANAYAERFVGSIKSECVNRLVFFGEVSLRRAIREYMTHYHHERNHRGVGNRLLGAATIDAPDGGGEVQRRSRLGGMLNYYAREAA